MNGDEEGLGRRRGRRQCEQERGVDVDGPNG